MKTLRQYGFFLSTSFLLFALCSCGKNGPAYKNCEPDFANQIAQFITSDQALTSLDSKTTICNGLQATVEKGQILVTQYGSSVICVLPSGQYVSSGDVAHRLDTLRKNQGEN